MRASIAVVVVTHHARDLLDRCLPMWLAAPERPRVVVLNSCSRDGTVERARALGAETCVLPRSAFDHGAAREWLRRRLDCDIVTMVTPDAAPRDESVLGALIEPIRDGSAAVAYGRQIAAPRAPTIERVTRRMNYPSESHLRGVEDAERWGSYLHFCSNAFAAWSNAALDRIGGFRPTLVSEDAIACAALLRAGYRVAYVAEAEVEHTHDLDAVGLFRRQFDIGWTRARLGRALSEWGRDERRGLKVAREILGCAAEEGPAAWIETFLHLAAAYGGHAAGRLSARAPDALGRRLGRALSSQDFYWSSDRDLGFLDAELARAG